MNPSLADELSEIPQRGMIAMAINGVPQFGAQESSSDNAVEPDDDVTQVNLFIFAQRRMFKYDRHFIDS